MYVWEAGVYLSRYTFDFVVGAGDPNANNSYITGCDAPNTTARSGEMCTQMTAGETTSFGVILSSFFLSFFFSLFFLSFFISRVCYC